MRIISHGTGSGKSTENTISPITGSEKPTWCEYIYLARKIKKYNYKHWSNRIKSATLFCFISHIMSLSILLFSSLFEVSKLGRTIIASYGRMNCTAEPAPVCTFLSDFLSKTWHLEVYIKCKDPWSHLKKTVFSRRIGRWYNGRSGRQMQDVGVWSLSQYSA